METQEKPTITLDGENYIVEDLSDTSKYCVSQLQDLQQQMQATKARVDQIEMSIRGFTDLLRKDLKGENDEGAE